MTELHSKEYRVMGAALGAENQLPAFRDPSPDHQVNFSNSIPAEKRLYAGWQTGYRCLPYRLQDSYSRKRTALVFQSLVLENEHLKAVFLPELGGRLVSLVHLADGRELLSHNPVFQPANLAIRNAWFSGGIEWNIGHYGHTFLTCAPVFAAEIRGLQGEPGVRLYEYERCHGLFWQIDFYLPEGSPVLIAYARVVNGNETESPFYWWTNVAVPQKPGTRVLAPGRQVLYLDFSKPDVFGLAEAPDLPYMAGDASYPEKFNCAGEYFYQPDGVELPWETALDEKGAGFFEASTGFLKYRKMFCWGKHAGGRRWQEVLSEPGEEYLEIQAGMTPTQAHGLPMPAGSTWDWLQIFGLFEGDPQQVHQKDYQAAVRSVDIVLRRQFPADLLDGWLKKYRDLADSKVQSMRFAASGWGALELARRGQAAQARPIPAAFSFPAASLGDEQQKWLNLLKDGIFPAPDPQELPGEWMVQPEWQSLLEALPHKNWFAWLHIGIMRMENFDLPGAIRAWQESIRLEPSVWAYRNLAFAARRQANLPLTLEYYRKAVSLARAAGILSAALAVECLQTLHASGNYVEAAELIKSLDENVREADGIQLWLGRIALELGDLAAVERVFQKDFAMIREGESELTDLWADYHIHRLAGETGRSVEEFSRQDILQSHPLPCSIDFRMS